MANLKNLVIYLVAGTFFCSIGAMAPEWVEGVLNCFEPKTAPVNESGSAGDSSGPQEVREVAIILSLLGNDNDGLDKRIFDACIRLRIPFMVMISGTWLTKHWEEHHEYFEQIPSELISFGTHGDKRFACLLEKSNVRGYANFPVAQHSFDLTSDVHLGYACLGGAVGEEKVEIFYYMPAGCQYTIEGLKAITRTLAAKPLGFSIRGDGAGSYDEAKIIKQLCQSAQSGDIILYNAARPEKAWGESVAKAVEQATNNHEHGGHTIKFVNLNERNLISNEERQPKKTEPKS